MIIEGDPSNWQETFRQFVLLNDLSPHEAPKYQEFIESLVNSLTVAWGQIITKKVTESQDVVIPLSLLVKLGALVTKMSTMSFSADSKDFLEITELLVDLEVRKFVKEPTNQIYLPIKKS